MDRQQALTEAEEAVLLSSLRAGEQAAFEQLIRAYGGRLLAVARRIVRDEQEAQDALQESFLSALQAIGRFEGRSRLYTWLHRIVVHAALYKLRARKSRAESSIEDLLPQFLPDGHQTRSSIEWRELPERALDDRKLCALVRGCIDQLPEIYRTVLLLRDIEELDTEATARILQINEGAVKVRLHRARQALRTLLDPHFTTELAPERAPDREPSQ